MTLNPHHTFLLIQELCNGKNHGLRLPYNAQIDDMSPEIYLHVVCEYGDTVYTEFVTAYIPDEQEWAWPPLRRRKTKRR